MSIINRMNLGNVDTAKGGFSYIVHRSTEPATTAARLREIVSRYPDLRFIRIAKDASIGVGRAAVPTDSEEFVHLRADWPGKVFIQANSHQSAFPRGCYIGALRPFVASSADGSHPGSVYICSCYTHFTANRYAQEYALCNIDQITDTWAAMETRLEADGYPYM
jgi:hypothetical protein